MNLRLPPPLAVDAWPDEDRCAWLLANFADPLSPEGGGYAAAWRPTTRRITAQGYGSWLAWLSKRGDLDPNSSPAERASRERVRSYLDALENAGLADYTRAGRLQQLGDALRVMQPVGDCAFIGQAAGRIGASAKRKRDPRQKMRPIADILDLARDLMAFADTDEACMQLSRDLAFRDGLLVGIWILRALRISNLSSIELGRHLIEVDRGVYTLAFEAHEMKAHRPFDCSWPPAFVAALERYLRDVRPRLRARDMQHTLDDRLWISQFGRGMAPRSVAQIIELRTLERFGIKMNSHLPRYMVVSELARARPRSTTDGAAMLGHVSTETTERHYQLASTFAAAQEYQGHVAGLARKQHRARDDPQLEG